MQYDKKYGIIPDKEPEIQANYLSFFKNVFQNANSPDDPTYAIANTCAYFDSLNQAALEGLWNNKNSDTASGIGLDILANTVLNIFRRPLTPSTCVVKIVVENLLSYCDVTIDVTVSSPQIIATGWTVSGSVSPSPAYKTLKDYSIPTSGTYVLRVFSTDVSTIVPISSFTAGTSSSGVTFVSVDNLGAAILGTLTIPSDWAVTSSTLNPTPIYTPNQYYTYNKNGTYYILLYSTNILTNVAIGQLDRFTQINNVNDVTPTPMLASVTNQYACSLGAPPESDAQFSARRRYYLNVEGQTYFGMEKVIRDVNAPALTSVYVQEVIDDTYNASVLIVKITVTVPSGGTVVVPTNWGVTLSSATPTVPYKTIQAYTYSVSGTYYIPLFSMDHTTDVPIGNVTGGDVVSGLVVNGNLDPAILKVTVGLGQRGYKVYLDYPTAPYSICIIAVTVTSGTGFPSPIVIPIGWQPTGFTTTSPYRTQEAYSITAPGTYLITTYSEDYLTAVPPGSFTGGTAVTGLTFTATNTTAADLGGKFDTQDIYLQQIASACFEYHPLGTQFYAGGNGATTFVVNTPYSGFVSDVILNPIQQTQATVVLTLVYNLSPRDAGTSNGVFTADFSTLKENLIKLINDYFRSKTLPTDLMFSVNELSELIQSAYTGIVSLNSGTVPFTFGVPSLSTTGKVYLIKTPGYVFNLLDTNFDFHFVDKDTL